MKKFFEKLLYWEEFVELYDNDNINFVGNISSEPRADDKEKIEQLSRKCKCSSYLLNYDYEYDCFLCDQNKYNLQSETNKFIQKLDTRIPLILNITSMNLRLIGTMLYHIKKFEFEKVYCVYTEPLRYCKNKEGESQNKDRFDLYKKFKGISTIPGFLRENDKKLTERWVVFLGFEGKRWEQINEQYDFTNIVPVITLPSYQPGWHNYALEENMDLLKLADRKPEYIIANSYLSAYNYLQNITEVSPEWYIRVSPMGTKINALGALLFVLNNTKNLEILYDNPIAEGKMSEQCGTTYVYDISEVLNQRINDLSES